MKLQAGRNELLAALSAVIGVVEKRQTLPVLSNFLLDLTEEALTVTGTDLEIELRARANVECLEAGRATIPARKLFDICRALPEGANISIQMENDKAIIKSGRSRYSLACLRADDFPAMDRVPDGQAIEIPQKIIKSLIDKTQFAMAQQDVRYYLNGMLLEVDGNRIRTVATDGHRLALSDVEHKTGLTERLQVIVPRKAILELQRLMDQTDNLVKLTLSSSQIEASLDVVRLTSKAIEGRFPDYERVVPSGGNIVVEGEREAVRRALARAAILSSDKVRGVHVSLSEAKLKLQTQNPDQEQAEEEVEIEYHGHPVEIGFNVNYLLDALSALDGERFIMKLKDADSSSLIHALNDTTSKYVVMPMRI